jgi:hypothetical protein
MARIGVVCPECGERERHRAQRAEGKPQITCLACGNEWIRDPYDCPECGQRTLKPIRKPLIQKARGTQQSIIGYRIAKECASCGWASEE